MRDLVFPTVYAVSVALAVALASPVLAAADDDAVANLPPHWQTWLEEEVFPLISTEQRQAFLDLETEAQRQAFADRLWVLWGRQTGYGSAFRSIYQDRLELARLEFDSLRDPRSRVLLIHGPPPLRHIVKCTEYFVPIEIWGWPYIEGLGERVVVLFYQSGGLGQWRMWTGIEGRRVLYTLGGFSMRGVTTDRMDSPRFRCPDGDTTMNLMAAAEMWARDYQLLQAMYHLPDTEESGPESAARRFMEFSALLPNDALPLDVAVEEEPADAVGGLVQMEFVVRVPGAELGTSPVGGVNVTQLDVVGEVSRADTMIDRFRYLYSLPATESELALPFERFIRPGEYDLRVRVEDVHSKHAGVAEARINVLAPEQPRQEAEMVRSIELPESFDLTGDPEDTPPLHLVGPGDEVISGVQRFEAVASKEVASVSFLVGGRPVLTKNRPPFDVDLDLGPLPRLTAVTAVAYDAEGHEIDRDRLSLNVGRERFYVRLEPLTGRELSRGEVVLRVEVNTPGDADLDTIELFWNDDSLATLTAPPYETRVTVPSTGQFGVMRAVATLDDGSVAEDIQFANAPEFGSVVEVTAVELPVTVLGRDGRPVENLAVEDFTVVEDGTVQQVTHFSLHRDLPIRLGLVLDTSGSMEETLSTVQEVVMGFLRQLLRPRDRAMIVTFSDRADLVAPFTADFTTLENALLSLYADRATALYDSIIMGMFQFSGVRGRKAMVVLTDGEDTASESDFEEVMRYAQRQGVTVYTIGIDIPLSKVLTRWQLNRLADVTGGRSFFVSSGSELDRIYNEIDRELRTQYLLAYTSSSDKPVDELRKVDVEVDRPGVKVRTIAGYYPAAS